MLTFKVNEQSLPKQLFWYLWLVCCGLVVCDSILTFHDVTGYYVFNRVFDMTREESIPNWYASILLFCKKAGVLRGRLLNRLRALPVTPQPLVSINPLVGTRRLVDTRCSGERQLARNHKTCRNLTELERTIFAKAVHHL